MSSRNAYLSSKDRKAALALYRSLMEVQKLFQQGERNADVLMIAGKKSFMEGESARLDYLKIVDPDRLDSLTDIKETALAAVAGFVGTTRLIDNVLLRCEEVAVHSKATV